MKKKVKINYLATRGGYVITIHKKEKELPKTAIVQELYVGETGAPVKAVSKPDTIFTGWSDGVKSNPRTDTGSENVDIIANFKMKPWWERFIDWIWGRRDPIVQSKY